MCVNEHKRCLRQPAVITWYDDDDFVFNKIDEQNINRKAESFFQEKYIVDKIVYDFYIRIDTSKRHQVRFI